MTNRPLRVFLCHSSNDKPAVRELYQKLRAEPWIQPWLDEEELYPGQDWNMEIEKAVEAADAIIVCLSKGSITKEGYIQRELRIVLDYADYKPEGTLYLMPVRLEECEPPRRLRAWQYADCFEDQRERGVKRLIASLKMRADSLDLKIETSVPLGSDSNPIKKTPAKEQDWSKEWLASDEVFNPLQKEEKPIEENNFVAAKNEPNQVVKQKNVTPTLNKITLPNDLEFMRVPAGKFLMGNDNEFIDEKPQHLVDIPYDFWMARFPVTNGQYIDYVKTKWYAKHPVDNWEDKKDHPVAYITWNDAMKYCQWLNNLLIKDKLPSWLVLRLPTEAEWEKASRGTLGRKYPWGDKFDSNICNVNENYNRGTTPVYKYSPSGDSPYGCSDMVGNVWEWTNSLYRPYPYNLDDGREDRGGNSNKRVFRGGLKIFTTGPYVHCAIRGNDSLDSIHGLVGFRVVMAPKLSKE